MNKPCRFTILVGAALCALLVSQTRAGILPFDPNAIPSAQGSQVYSKTVNAHTLDGNVEYAVYAPGQFDLTFGPGADPSNGTQFVYAYQVYNTGIGALASEISFLTVGLFPTANASNLMALPNIFGNYGLDPLNVGFAGAPPSSARWNYTTVAIGLGLQSDILLFTSPYAPDLRPVSIQGGGIGQTHVLPSPVPEPSSIALLVFGAAALFGWRRFARRRK